MLVEKIKSKINLNENKKNVAKISFGTLGGQAISFITLPILTRMYGASVIGTWTLFNSIALIINSFSDLSITKSGPESVNCNEEFTYRIIVKNSGDLPESGLSIVDMLPNNFKIADKGIVVMRNSKILSENIDYKLTISCDEITIGGTNDKPLEIGGNQVITVDITGLVRCIR